MHLENLRLINFRSYEKFETDFSDKINIITGNNGIGKSSVLEAVHYLSLSKSFRSNRDEEAIHFNSDHFVSKGTFVSDDGVRENISISFSKNGGKAIKSHGKLLENSRDLIGRHPVVLLSPEDIITTIGSPSGQRKFMNMTMSQVNKNHLSRLMSYRGVLKQRNAAINMAASGRESYESTLDALEEQLGELCSSIWEDRVNFINEIFPEFQKIFNDLNEGKKEGTIEYRPSVSGTKNEIMEVFKLRRANDFNMGFTTKGLHRDKLIFKINDRALKKYGSKGENKSFMIALRLTQGKFIEKKTGIKPIYLLDDVFMELDRNRAIETVKYINGIGQVIITTTNYEEWSDKVGFKVNLIGLS